MSAGLPAPLSALLQPVAYPHAVEYVRLVKTHVSWVLLTGQYAYKIKRPVRFPFVDLRDFEKRAFFCAEEVRLNRRFAPDLYLGVSQVRVSAGKATIDGPGEVIEHAVRMRQFEPGQELDRLLDARAVAPAEIARFGRGLSAMHERVDVVTAAQPWGAARAVRALLLENLRQCAQVAAGLGTDADVDALRAPFEARIVAAEDWMEARRAGGRVRECHGDLHARNVARHEGELLAFDCMEFEPAFRWIDVADEIAFLFMDLDARGWPQHAHAFLDGYLAASGDYAACRGLRLYTVHRALVRAKVAAIEATSASSLDERASAADLHRAYLQLARCNVAAAVPKLVLMHGYSGSGKTWLASSVAPLLRAVHVRSDVERKRMAGLDELADSRSLPQQGLYAASMSERVYGRLAHCAQDVLGGGYTAIVDAAFLRREQRAPFVALAADCGADLTLVDCRAPPDVLRTRIEDRRRGRKDASEADLTVLEWQLANHEPVDPAENLRAVEIDTTAADPASGLLRILEGPACA